jgi:hypothetical protein
MAVTEKTISGLIPSQLPDFVKADHPQFKRFVELYYKWLETNNPEGVSNTAGNTVYHAMNIGDYRDIDQTPDEFITYFKQELIPYFPENTALDLRKILKSAREFYSKKGSEESLKWLFKVLFNEDIQINYPKDQILKTSDGKWKKPKAFRITVGETNKNIDVNLLEKKLGVGSISGATCVIESADRTLDTDTGREIIEIYISNIKRYFNNGENIVINYTDADGVARVFSEKIIGTISNIYLDSNIKTDPKQKRRGLLYNVGDPVVITGGLASTPEARPGVAIVGNVSTGSIESVTSKFPGYGYRLYPDTEVLVLRSVGDDPNANANTDLRVDALNLKSSLVNSQINFIETISYDKTVIDYLGDVLLSSSDYAEFTSNNINAVLNVTEADAGDGFNNFEEVWANGTNFYDAKFTAKIATSNTTGPFAQGGIFSATGGLLVYDVANTGALATVLSGKNIYTKNTAKSFTFNSLTTYKVSANANSKIAQCLHFESVETGGITLISVIDGGAGFRSAPTLRVSSQYDTILSENYDYGTTDRAEVVQTFKDLGQIAHIYINNRGLGYADGDTITFSGRGYSGSAYVTVGSGGVIKSITITDRGEGHLVRPTCIVNSAAGTGAVLTAYLFGDGYDYKVETSAIGRIKDIRLIYRGYDYISRPNVSLKVMDTVIKSISEGQELIEQEYIYQGTSLSTSTFRANVASYDRSTNLLRLYDYSGILDTTLDLITANAIHCSVNTSVNVAAPIQYNSITIASGLPNPMIYGNGKAKANALFANGLIEFNGFYVNTDGFVSADKVLQDGEIYHNYSYVIQSNKDLADYKSSLKNIAHPSGMKPISKRIIASESDSSVTDFPSVNYIKPINSSSNVQVLNPYSNVVTGNATAFTNSTHKANVGDLFIISDPGNPLRSLSKIITSVDSATQLKIDGDFIYAGQGKVSSNKEYTQLTGTVTTNPAVTGTFTINPPVTGTVKVNAPITGSANVIGSNAAVIGTVNTASLSNVVTGNISTGTLFTALGANDTIRVNNQIRKIVSITNNYHLIVNAVFTYGGTDNLMYATSNTVVANTSNGTSFTTNLVANDIIVVNNQIRQVVSIPNANYLIVNTPFTYNGTDNIVYAKSNTVVGSGTTFTTNIAIGDIITINGEIREVISVGSNGLLNVNSQFSNYATGASLYNRSNVVVGVGGNLDPQVNVGDTITVNNQIRKVTVRGAGSDNYLEVNAIFSFYGTGLPLYKQNTIVLGSGTNFSSTLVPNNYISVNNQIREVVAVTDGTHFVVNTPFTYYESGNNISKLSNTTVVISGATNSISDFIQVGDGISFNIAVANIVKAQTGTVQVFTQNAKVVGTSTNFTANLKSNDIVMIANQMRRVINIASATVMNLNTSFESGVSGEILYKQATYQNANVVSISGSNLTLNIAYGANVVNLVYQVAPNYSSADYSYKIITLTAD